MADQLSPLFSWRSAITESDLPATTRLVALVLSLHMNERGGSCYPSQSTLARETGLHPETVKEHLRTLRTEGWLVAKEMQGKTTRYTADLPTELSTTGGSRTQGSTTPGGPPPPHPGVLDPGDPGVLDPPEDVNRTTGERQTPQTPQRGAKPNPSCPWCYGTGWLENDDRTRVDPCGCTRSPNRKPRGASP